MIKTTRLTPFHLAIQVRDLAEARDFYGTKMGLPEGRSSEQWIDFDVRHNLGFLDNPKRFNVAITRAIALLIVVGNPMTLKADYHWRELLKYCVAHGAYRGIPLPDLSGHDGDDGDDDSRGDGGDGDEGEDFVQAIEDLLLKHVEEEDPSQQMQQEAMEMPSHDW